MTTTESNAVPDVVFCVYRDGCPNLATTFLVQPNGTREPICTTCDDIHTAELAEKVDAVDALHQAEARDARDVVIADLQKQLVVATGELNTMTAMWQGIRTTLRDVRGKRDEALQAIKVLLRDRDSDGLEFSQVVTLKADLEAAQAELVQLRESLSSNATLEQDIQELRAELAFTAGARDVVVADHDLLAVHHRRVLRELDDARAAFAALNRVAAADEQYVRSGQACADIEDDLPDERNRRVAAEATLAALRETFEKFNVPQWDWVDKATDKVAHQVEVRLRVTLADIKAMRAAAKGNEAGDELLRELQALRNMQKAWRHG